jgi:hypothetical protein
VSRIWRNETLSPDPDRMSCAVCGFPGVPLDFVPAPDTDVTLIPSTSAGGLRVAEITVPGHCPFCGTNMPDQGRRGDL